MFSVGEILCSFIVRVCFYLQWTDVGLGSNMYGGGHCWETVEKSAPYRNQNSTNRKCEETGNTGSY